MEQANDSINVNNEVADNKKENTVNINFKSIIEWILYLLGILFLYIGFSLYFQDLKYYDNPMRFYEEQFVGGDAYNYIISAARSAAVMIKSLIWIVLGCSSIIIGRTLK